MKKERCAECDCQLCHIINPVYSARLDLRFCNIFCYKEHIRKRERFGMSNKRENQHEGCN